jgi:CheY-like chemotaxis protein
MDAGLEAETAADGQAALTLIDHAELDLVLSAINMASMDGFTLLRNLRARARPLRARPLPVIMLTARSSEEYPRRAVAEGADACPLKSGFQVASLLDTLSRSLPATF